MLDLVVSLVVLLLAGGAAVVVIQRYPPKEVPYLMGSLIAHVLSACALVLLYTVYYDGGDITGYHRNGSRIADMVRLDPDRLWPAVFRMLFQQPDNVIAAGQSSTGTMTALSTLLMYGLAKSLWAACILVAIGSFAGKFMIFESLSASLPERYRQRTLVACLWMPSVVFWSSGVVKEAFAIIGVGIICAGMARALKNRMFGLTIMGLGMYMIALIKPYILFPAVISCSVWYYWSRTTSRKHGVGSRSTYLFVGLLVALGAYTVIAQFFPGFSIAMFGESAAIQREASLTAEGGSNFVIGDTTDRSLSGQMVYAPLALVTTLFRPTIFEVRNPLMLVSALETTFLTVLTLRSVWNKSPGVMFRTVLKEPVVLFSFTFAVLMAIGVGLGTTNFGTLSRYRIPLMPFFALCVFVWAAPAASTADERSAVPTKPVAPPRLFGRAARLARQARRRDGTHASAGDDTTLVPASR